MTFPDGKPTPEQIEDAEFAAKMDRGLFTLSVTAAELFNRHPILQSGFAAIYEYVEEFTQVERPARRSSENRAAVLVLNQALNDFLDLVLASVSVRGRPCLSHARSLFEHALAMRDVLSDPVARARYEDHAAIALSQYGQLTADVQLLTGPRRKALEHRRKKLRRDTERETKQALDRWGSSFVSGWHQSNNFDRASKAGWPTDDYEFYRFSSAFLHGAAGGTVGSIRDVDHERVHRLGPAMEVAPPALAYGLRFMRRILEAYDQEWPSEPARRLLQLIRIWQDKVWEVYHSAVSALDENWWPTEGVVHAPVAVLGLGPYNTFKWYVHDYARGRIAVAAPPEKDELSEEFWAGIAEVRQRADEDGTWDGIGAPLGQSGLFLVVVPNIVLLPAREARWMPDGAVLINNKGKPLQPPVLGALADIDE